MKRNINVIFNIIQQFFKKKKGKENNEEKEKMRRVNRIFAPC